jgi:hypothetical protein
MVTCKFAQNEVVYQRLRGSVQKSPSSKATAIFTRGAYYLVREHGKMARTPLAAFFNRPILM